MRKWKSQMALLLSGTIAITSIAPAGGITNLAAEKSAKVSQSGIWKGVAPSRTRKASPSDGEKASPSEIQKKERFDAETSVAYLSDMELEDEHIGWGGKWFRDCNVGVDTGLDGGPITIILPDQGGVRSFKKGLAANAKSDAIIDVSKYQEQVFFALVGVDYTKPTGSCTFEVLTSADGSTWTSQWKSTGIRTGKDEAERVLFTIPKDAVKLKLVIGDGGNGNKNDNGVWASASILSSREGCSSMVEAEVSAPSYLKVNEAAPIAIAAYGLDGKKIDSGSLTVTAESDNEDTLITEEDNGGWKVTGVSDGTATVTVTIEKDGVTEEETFQIIVGKGDENTWRVESPDGSQTLLFFMNEEQGVDFVAITDGEETVGKSSTGIKTSVGDFTSGLTYDDISVKRINDSYNLIGAKTSYVENEAEEMTLSFIKEDAEYEIIARAYDDGFALCYSIPSAGEADEVKISEENTSFQLPKNSTSYAMDYTPYHERAPQKKNNSQLTGTYAMPLLYETNSGTWGLISEAGLSGSYCGGSLAGRGDGLVDVEFAPEQKKAVEAAVPFQSPWRFAVIGDPETISDNTMPENLSPECAIEDTSWIKPGVTGWTWLNKDKTDDFETYKRYVDMAAEMGWEYVLMDEHWQPIKRGGSNDKKDNWITDEDGYHRKFPDWLDELVSYADEKGVGLLAWAWNQDFDTEEEAKILEVWAKKGIKGIKIDFFNSQDQDTIKKYDMLMEKTAECHLLLNPHGSNKPTGERRTWPQALTREGILGAEQHRQGGKGSLTAEYNCLIPFTRGAVGPSDYTPLMSYQLVDENVFTVSQMAAHSIVFESGIPCLADKPEVYLNSPAKSLLTHLPASWDESHLLAGEPGDYVNMARRSGDDWYIGIICNKKQDAEVDLSFLEDGTYYASVYKDGETKEDIAVEMRTVTSEDVLIIPLAEKGGASIKITKEAPAQPEKIILSKEEITIVKNATAVITATVEPEGTEMNAVTWTSSDETVATVNHGIIKGVNSGTAVITASTGFDGSVSAACTVTVIDGRYELDRDTWAIQNENPDNWILNSGTSLTITSESGEYGNSVSNAKNVFFTDVTGDFIVSTKLSFEPEADYQSAGIILYVDNKNVFEALRRYHHSFGNRCFDAVNIVNGKLSEKSASDDYQGEAIYLKVNRAGNTCTAYYSVDNENWTKLGDTVTNEGLSGADLKIGLYCVNGNNKGGAVPATFEDVTLEKEGIAEVIPFINAEDEEWEQLKDDLRELIQLGKAYEAEEEIYTEDSFGIFKKAINAAKEALEKEEAKEILAGCYETLEAAIKGLVKKEDTEDKELEKIKAELAELINFCAGYEEDVYTESSYAELTKAKKAAEDALVQEETKDVLLGCHKALKAAIEGLVKKEDTEDKELEKIKSELKELIDSCMKYEENAYTESSFAVLKAALVSAKKALADVTSGKERLVDCYNNLLNASKNLEKVKNESSNGGSSSGSSYTSASASGPKWVQDAMGWWLRNKDGSYPKEQWASMTENGKIVWYYFDADGYMKDGWLNVNEKTYFLHNIADGTRGAMYTGWHMIEGKWYYFEEKEGADQGMLLTDCVTPDGYRVNANGVWVR